MSFAFLVALALTGLGVGLRSRLLAFPGICTLSRLVAFTFSTVLFSRLLPAGFLSSRGFDFFFHFVEQIIQFAPRRLERFRLVAQHAFRRLLDALLQFVDAFARLLLRLAGLRNEAAFHQFRRDVEVAVEIILTRLAQRVVELFGQQRFGRLRLLGDLPHVLREVGQRALLLRELRLQLLPLAGLRQAPPLGFPDGLQLLRDVLLILRQLPRLVAHLAHLFGELLGILFAELIAQLLQLPLRARAGAEGLRGLAVVELLRRLLRLVAGLVELLARVGHRGLVLLLFHALLQFVDVLDHFLLLLAQALEPPLHLLALGLGLGLLHGGLQLLHLFIDVLLPAREFAQAVQHLQLLLLAGILGLRAGLFLRLVPILRLLEIKLVDLALRARLALAFAGAALALRDHVFVRLQFEQRLIRRGLGSHRRAERFRGIALLRFVQ